MKLIRKSNGREYIFKGVENSDDLGFTLVLEAKITVKGKVKKVKRSFTYYYWEDIIKAMNDYTEATAGSDGEGSEPTPSSSLPEGAL